MAPMRVLLVPLPLYPAHCTRVKRGAGPELDGVEWGDKTTWTVPPVVVVLGGRGADWGTDPRSCGENEATRTPLDRMPAAGRPAR